MKQKVNTFRILQLYIKSDVSNQPKNLGQWHLAALKQKLGNVFDLIVRL